MVIAQPMRLSCVRVQMGPPRRQVNVAAALALAAALAGCAAAPNEEQARLCRLVAATLGPPGTRVEVLAQSGRQADDGLDIARIDVLLHPPDHPPRRDFVVCRFAGRGAGTPALVGVTTERGPFSETRLHLLRRFWLDEPESALEDPAPFGGLDAPGAPRWAALALQHAANALPGAAVAGLLAGAYALIYGLTGRINLAFGELAAAAGYAAFYGLAFARSAGLALALAMTTAAAYGAATARLVFLPLRRASGLQTLVATVGLATFLQEFLRLSQGASSRFAPAIMAQPIPLLRAGDFVATANPLALLAAALALTAAAMTLLVLKATRLGREWRAASQDPLAAQLFGVRPATILSQTFLIASALAGLAGYLATLRFGQLGAGSATALGLSALTGAVLGGVGSVGGAMLGGALVGLFGEVWSALFPIVYRDVAVYAILTLTLALRPHGLFGDADEASGRRLPPIDRETK
jgi:branched-chain amino acid transport system permease protein